MRKIFFFIVLIFMFFAAYNIHIIQHTTHTKRNVIPKRNYTGWATGGKKVSRIN